MANNGTKYMITIMTIMMVFMVVMIKADIACKKVTDELKPCLGFVQNGGTVSPECCTGAKALQGLAKTPADRKSVCSCLKTQLKNVKLKPDNLNKVPAMCKISLPYKITPTIDCNSVNY